MESVLTSGTYLSEGKRVPVQTFTLQDYVVSLVDFQWDDAQKNGGIHDVNWRWYHDGRLVSSSGKSVSFTSTPFTLRTRRAAATLGIGHFKVETVVDGNLAGSSEFDITP
jgi:hypothetical protein